VTATELLVAAAGAIRACEADEQTRRDSGPNHVHPRRLIPVCLLDWREKKHVMTAEEVLSTARDAMMVRQVFAEPHTQDGITVIAAAKVIGGGGGGGGRDQQGQQGDGGGFGLIARPVGAYVIKDGRVRWVPAVDVNRLILVIGAVAVVALRWRRGVLRK
jgi:uncharacterized spore protein YtfJ